MLYGGKNFHGKILFFFCNLTWYSGSVLEITFLDELRFFFSECRSWKNGRVLFSMCSPTKNIQLPSISVYFFFLKCLCTSGAMYIDMTLLLLLRDFALNVILQWGWPYGRESPFTFVDTACIHWSLFKLTLCNKWETAETHPSCWTFSCARNPHPHSGAVLLCSSFFQNESLSAVQKSLYAFETLAL